MDDSFKLPGWARQILVGAGLFVLGGVIAFGYSWRPLHGSLTWKIAALEEKLDARNLENLKLADELARLRSQEAERVDPEAYQEARTALEKTEAALAQAEKDLARADRKRKDANASARTWRKRYETLRDETSRAPVPAAPAQVPAPAEAPEAPAAPPASPSADGTPAAASPGGTEPAILGGGDGASGAAP